MSVLDLYAGFVLDLDGVVVRGEQPVDGAAEFLSRLRKSEKPLAFVTNNSYRTPSDWVSLLAAAGIKAFEDEIITSAIGAARSLARDSAPPHCYVIGGRGLMAALGDRDIPIVEDHQEADTVIVGYDPALTYEKLRRAARAIIEGARFVATNPDVLFPQEGGAVPGTGASLAYLRAATGVAPEVIGKPQTAMCELAAERLGVEEGGILSIGDQVSTDVVSAARMGWDAALVLTGVSTWTDLIGVTATPRWVVRSLDALVGPEPPEIRHAREADLSDIRGLLSGLDVETDGASRRLRDTLVAEDPDGRVVGTIAWELIDHTAHLRAMVVAPHERGHGTGSHLVVRALDELRSGGVNWVYLLTPGADGLFERLGFWSVSRERVPEEVLETAQYGAASGATAFVRRLRPIAEAAS